METVHLCPYEGERVPHIPYLYIDVGAYVQYNPHLGGWRDSTGDQTRYVVNKPFIVPFEVGGREFVYRTGDGNYAWYVGEKDSPVYDQFFVSRQDPHIRILDALL